MTASHYAVGIFASVVAYVSIGHYAGRRVKGVDDYYVAGRNAPTLFIVGTLIASFLSTAAFLGETGFAYQGYAGVMLILVALNLMGYVIGAVYFGRYIRRSRAITVAEYFGKRFNSRRVQAAAGTTIIIGLSAYLLAVTQGASLVISEAVDIPYDVTLLIVWGGYTWFTARSGSQGVVVTDTVMFFLFTIITFATAFYIISATGGWFDTISTLAAFDAKPGIISWHGVNGPGARFEAPVDALSWALVLGAAWGITIAVSPWQSSRYLMAKNEHVVIRSACAATGIALLFYCALFAAATSVNLLKADIFPSETVMIWAAMNVLPGLAGVLLMSGIVAAALSSASTFLSLIAFSATNDLVELKVVNEHCRLSLSRYAMLIIGVVILGLAHWQPPAILEISYFAATLFASSWGPVAFMSVWSERITSEGAFWGIVVGFTSNFVVKMLTLYGLLTLPVLLDPIVIGILLSLLTILAISRCTQVTTQERGYREDLHKTPAAELDTDKSNATLKFAVGLMACGAVLAFAMALFYVGPQATVTNDREFTTAPIERNLVDER